MNSDDTTVIVGGGMAGARTASSLREHGYIGRIVLIGAERYLPYDRPPLSKAGLAGEVDTTFDIDFPGLGVEVRPGVSATGLNPAHRIVYLDSSEAPEIRYDTLVIATGAAPVTLAGHGPQRVLRTREDAESLRGSLVAGARVLLVGAGWINAEVATAALARDCRVTCLELGPAPLAAALGERIGSRLSSLWGAVDLRCGVGVREVIEGGVITGSGEVVEGDVVLVGVGVRPQTAWLEGSGLAIDRAVLVDAEHRSSDPRIFAVGDAAARMSARYGTTIWGEHWDEARTGPAVVGAVIAKGSADAGDLDEVPYFWSDQFGKKIQYVGHHDDADRLVVREGIDGRWGAAWISPDGILRAHLTVSAPRYTATARSAIEAGTIVAPEEIGDLAAPLR